MPLPKHWTVLGQGRHKGPAQSPFPGTAHRGLRGSDANLETLSPRFFDLSPRAYRRGCSAPRHRHIHSQNFCGPWRQTHRQKSAGLNNHQHRRNSEPIAPTTPLLADPAEDTAHVGVPSV
jgi:hypothetical protein